MRSSIINDAYGLNRANRMSSIEMFQIYNYLENEREHLPWSIFLNHVTYYENIFESTEAYGYLQAHLINIIRPIYAKLGWNSGEMRDSWSDRKLRYRIIRFACSLGLHDCITKASNLYQDWMSDYRVNKFAYISTRINFLKRLNAFFLP